MNWADWVAQHCLIFSLESSEDSDRVAHWARLFAAEGRTPAQMAIATDRMAVSNPPKWKSDHLRILRDTLTILDREKSKKAPEPARILCQRCQDSGRVPVPVRDPQTREFRVGERYCRCAAGARVQQGDTVLEQVAKQTQLF